MVLPGESLAKYQGESLSAWKSNPNRKRSRKLSAG